MQQVHLDYKSISKDGLAFLASRRNSNNINAETPIEEELSTSEVTTVAATAVAFEVLAAMAGVGPRSRRGRRSRRWKRNFGIPDKASKSDWDRFAARSASSQHLGTVRNREFFDGTNATGVDSSRDKERPTSESSCSLY
jgi:hypothetical protein